MPSKTLFADLSKSIRINGRSWNSSGLPFLMEGSTKINHSAALGAMRNSKRTLSSEAHE